jgi:hypothetical protein
MTNWKPEVATTFLTELNALLKRYDNPGGNHEMWRDISGIVDKHSQPLPEFDRKGWGRN